MSYHHISGIHIPIYNRKDDWYNHDSYSSKPNTFHVQTPASRRESSEKADHSASATLDWIAAAKAMWFTPFSTVVRVQCHVEFGGLNMLASLDPYVTQQPTWPSSAIPDYPLSESRDVLRAEQPIDSHTLETTPIKIHSSKCDVDDLIDIPDESTENGSLAQACGDCTPALAASCAGLTEPLEPRKESTKTCPAPPATLARHSPTTVNQSFAVLEQTIAIQGRSNLPPVIAPSSRLNRSLNPTTPTATSSSLKPSKLTARANSTSRQGLNSLCVPLPSYHPARHSRLRRVKQFKSGVEPSAKQLMISLLPAKRDGSPGPPPPASFNPLSPVIRRVLWRLHGPLSLQPAYFWVLNRESDAPISFSSSHSSAMGQESRDSGFPSNDKNGTQSGQGPGPDLSSIIRGTDIASPDALPDGLRPLVEEWVAVSSVYEQPEAPTVQQYREPLPPPPLRLFVDILLRSYCIGRFDGWDDMLPPIEMHDQAQQPALPIGSTMVYGTTPYDLAPPAPPGPQRREDAPIPTASGPANTATMTLCPANPALSSATHSSCPSSPHSLPQSATPRNMSAYRREPLESNTDESFLTNGQASHTESTPRIQPVKNNGGFLALHSNQLDDATIIVPTVPPQMYGYRSTWAPISNIASFEPGCKAPPEVAEHRHHCHSCRHSYQKPYQLADHIAAKHTNAPKQHHCKFGGCNRAYTTRSNMIKHFNKDHRSVDVPQISLEATGQQPQPGTTEQMLAAGILINATIPEADTYHPGRFVPYNKEGDGKKYARHRRRK